MEIVFKRVWTALFIASFCLALGLKFHTVTSMSPTFDEPYHLFQGVFFEQSGYWYEPDVHPMLTPWILAKLSPILGVFNDVESFTQTPEWFLSPYQYRLDVFSHLEGGASIERARFIWQFFWLILLFSSGWICAHLQLTSWQTLSFLSLLMLEPFFLGLSSLVTNDFAALSFLVVASALSLTRLRLLWFFSIGVFSLAWATKLTAALWLLPLSLGLISKKIPVRTLVFWALGTFGGLWISYKIEGWMGWGQLLGRSNFRLSFLDGVFYASTPATYFLQGFLCKSSLSLLSLLGFVCFHTVKSKNTKNIAQLIVFVLGFIIATMLLPGIGMRLVLPLVFALVFFLCLQIPNEKIAYLLLCLLLAEGIYHRNGILSYQNPLAGSTPRLLDSNTDWGQGLKQLGEWRRQHPQEKLALAIFGGTFPETYQIKDYFALPSYPDLSPKIPRLENTFLGYVAVSKNLLAGYPFREANLLHLNRFTPLQCFQGALCLYDVRNFQHEN